MARSKKVSAEIAPVAPVEILPPTVDIKYILVTVETNLAGKHYLEEAVSKKMVEGWKPQGGIDVKSTSVNGWLFSQAMIKE